jgi:hypothetical protein
MCPSVPDEQNALSRLAHIRLDLHLLGSCSGVFIDCASNVSPILWTEYLPERNRLLIPPAWLSGIGVKQLLLLPSAYGVPMSHS